MSEGICTYIWPSQKGSALTSSGIVGNTIYYPRKGSTLISTGMVGHTIYHPEKGSALTSIVMIGHTIYHPGKGPALISDHGRNTSKNHIERLNTYIWPWEEHIQESCQKGSALISNHRRNTSKNHVRKDQHLYLAMWRTHPASILERLSTYIYPCGEHISHPC